MTQSIFDHIAENYDTPDRIALANVIAKKVKENLKETTDKTMIDYGSGTGLVGLQLTEQVHSLLLLDASEKMTSIAKKKLAQQSFPNVQAQTIDLTKENSPVKTDILLVSLVLLHIPDTKQILQKLYDTLENNGRLLIVDFVKNEAIQHPLVHNGFSQDELETQLQSTGFHSIQYDVFHQGDSLFMNQAASVFLAEAVK
ncbi:class I SAM-dependent DNA methyltransferase [Enterococcus sp. JM9B]|uniref:class I SAM-dependent DNA methyltransferase n=1 Tax=Enterococcus sp. JM9B TaxID=1857216 RepID=UPI001374A4BD|nr:methyltransferase domain-containing protein [Enterococcus sp. JM9B]KAF1300877.1 methylase [Enterococcus sp. JM9B]